MEILPDYQNKIIIWFSKAFGHFIKISGLLGLDQETIEV